ncbi:hypothetical protein FPQ18DRAFT_367715 [Pyronema domesticum]|nr:hypothetical protein FPQ18DRAFT_367715 [Pyronema domesticum]
MAHYLSEYNHHRDAQAPAQRSFMIRVKLLGEEHVDTLQAMGTVAVLLSSNGKLKEAEEMHTKVVEARIGVLGEEHPDTLKAIDNITTTLHNQGRLKEAEKMETKVVEAKMRVVEAQIRVLGEQHPDTLTAMHNLARTLRDQGRLKDAQEMYTMVVEARIRCIGDLALAFHKQARFEEAMPIQIKNVHNSSKRVLGKEHLDTLKCMCSLANTYYETNHINETIAMVEEAATLRSRILGSEHPHAKDSMEALSEWKEEHELDEMDIDNLTNTGPIIEF